MIIKREYVPLGVLCERDPAGRDIIEKAFAESYVEMDPASKDEQLNTARGDKGTLLASGFIAGGALMGVVSAALRFAGLDLMMDASWTEGTMAEVLSLVMYLVIIFYCIRTVLKKKD